MPPVSLTVELPVTRFIGTKPGANDLAMPCTLVTCEVDTHDASTITRILTESELAVDSRSTWDILTSLYNDDIADYLRRSTPHVVCDSNADALQTGLRHLNWDEALPYIKSEIWWTFYSEKSVHELLTDDELIDIIGNMRLSLLETALDERGYSLSAK